MSADAVRPGPPAPAPTPTGPGRNIVLLSDGTGNSAAKLFRTNVWRLHQALDLRSGDQVASYDDGVGTESFRPLALIGGAFGYGLAGNVRQLYTFLCRNYRAGDRIFLFGFSRGAFTVRMLVGLIHNQGLVQAADEEGRQRAARAAFRAYRAGYRNWRSRRTADVHPTAPSIAFLGVWDTVAAYGLPVEELAVALDRFWLWRLQFPDRRLSPIVERACHALALDDERYTFAPILWDEAAEVVRAARGRVRPGRIQQVWFAGAHSNVGGGYPRDELALVSLGWMMDEARRAGLRFLPEPPPGAGPRPDPHGELYDSRAGLAAYYRYRPRRLDELGDDPERGVRIERPRIHDSVLRRIQANQVAYAPFSLPATYDVVASAGAAAPAPEPAGWAEWRQGRQERAWDLVLWRRLNYFLWVAVTLLALTAPGWLPWRPDRACAGGLLCLLDPVIGVLGALLPGLAGPWVAAFRQYPGALVGLVLAGAGLLAWNTGLKRRIAVEAGAAWRHVRQPTPAPPPPPEPPTPTTRLRNSWLAGAYAFWVRRVVPYLVIVLVGLVALGLANRLAFEAGNLLDPVCRPRAEPRPAGPIELATADGCRPTGVHLRAGRRYAVVVRVTGPWMDGPFAAGPGGYRTPLLWLGIPARRLWGEPWFRLVAQVGPGGLDHHGLDEGRNELRARADGELFLFVNDAVLGLFGWDRPYRWPWGGNQGSATIEVTPLD